MRTAVHCEKIGKRFAAPVRVPTTLKTAVLDLVRRRRRVETLRVETSVERWALRDVDLEIEAGGSLGIIGPNGSGKSTLLRILAGVSRPTTGRVAIEGRVAALLELATGFVPEFSGRENAIVNGLILGMTRRQVRERMDDILRFADIGDSIDQPVRTYSAGMIQRLGFAVAIHCRPDVLLLDECLAVGDQEFQARCRERIAELRSAGGTLVLVSHDLASIERFADRTIVLDAGRITASGETSEVVAGYLGRWPGAKR